MLYQLHEMQRSFLTPLMQWADASSKMFSNPVSPFAHTPFSQRIAAGYELMYRLGKDYEKPAFGIKTTTIKGEERRHHRTRSSSKSRSAACCTSRKTCRTPASPRWPSRPCCWSRRCPATTRPCCATPCAALLVDHDVYITDWTDARMVPLSEGPFHLDDYIYYVQDFIRLLGPDVHVISVCQPTVPVLAAISLMATRQRSASCRRP